MKGGLLTAGELFKNQKEGMGQRDLHSIKKKAGLNLEDIWERQREGVLKANRPF